MKYIAALCILAFTSIAVADDQFIPHMGDVPLMEGMTEVTEERVVFDKPGGMIVDVTLTGQMGHAAVFAFYEKSLGALGWKLHKIKDPMKRRFSREGETLEITAMFDGKIKLRLKPIE